MAKQKKREPLFHIVKRGAIDPKKVLLIRVLSVVAALVFMLIPENRVRSIARTTARLVNLFIFHSSRKIYVDFIIFN